MTDTPGNRVTAAALQGREQEIKAAFMRHAFEAIGFDPERVRANVQETTDNLKKTFGKMWLGRQPLVAKNLDYEAIGKNICYLEDAMTSYVAQTLKGEPFFSLHHPPGVTYSSYKFTIAHPIHENCKYVMSRVPDELKSRTEPPTPEEIPAIFEAALSKTLAELGIDASPPGQSR